MIWMVPDGSCMFLLACDEQGADVHVVTLVESVHVCALRGEPCAFHKWSNFPVSWNLKHMPAWSQSAPMMMV